MLHLTTKNVKLIGVRDVPERNERERDEREHNDCDHYDNERNEYEHNCCERNECEHNESERNEREHNESERNRCRHLRSSLKYCYQPINPFLTTPSLTTKGFVENSQSYFISFFVSRNSQFELNIQISRVKITQQKSKHSR